MDGQLLTNMETNNCPICGSSDIDMLGHTTRKSLKSVYYCECYDCEWFGPFATNERDAIMLWNRRRSGIQLGRRSCHDLG